MWTLKSRPKRDGRKKDESRNKQGRLLIGTHGDHQSKAFLPTRRLVADHSPTLRYEYTSLMCGGGGGVQFAHTTKVCVGINIRALIVLIPMFITLIVVLRYEHTTIGGGGGRGYSLLRLRKPVVVSTLIVLIPIQELQLSMSTSLSCQWRWRTDVPVVATTRLFMRHESFLWTRTVITYGRSRTVACFFFPFFLSFFLPSAGVTARFFVRSRPTPPHPSRRPRVLWYDLYQY